MERTFTLVSCKEGVQPLVCDEHLFSISKMKIKRKRKEKYVLVVLNLFGLELIYLNFFFQKRQMLQMTTGDVLKAISEKNLVRL